LLTFRDFLPAGVEGGHRPVEGHLVGEAVTLGAGVVHHGVEAPIVRRPRGWRWAWGSTAKKKIEIFKSDNMVQFFDTRL
jgi:hypothetical protein